MTLEMISLNTNIVTKCNTKKLKRKKNFRELRIDSKTLELFEELNNQIDKEMKDTLKNIRNVIVK